MELSYDWRGFQGLFYPHRRASALQGAAAAGPVYLVLEGDVIISAFADHEDLSSWLGGSFAELKAQSKHRELLAFQREGVDKMLEGSLALPQFYDQVEQLKTQARPNGLSRRAGLFNRHFLLEGLAGWWSKVLPSSFGIYLRVEGQPDQELLVIMRRGSFSGFCEPDLAALSQERRRQPAEVVRHLSEKYLVPVQGLYVSNADWQEWARSPHPWKSVARAIKTNRARMVPFRWSLATLMATRAFLGF